MRLLENKREQELLGNARRSLDDCLAKLKARDYEDALRTLLIGIDTLSNLGARLMGDVTTEAQAERDNRKRFIGFLRREIPEWNQHRMFWEGKPIQLDLAELSYVIRCKQLHEYSSLTSPDFAIRLRWDHPLWEAPFMWIGGKPNSAVVECVQLNGFKLLQRLVEVAQRNTGLFGATATRMNCRIDPWAVYRVLGTVR